MIDIRWSLVNNIRLSLTTRFNCQYQKFTCLEIPVKKEVKATVSGIYITEVKGIRGPLATPEAKKGFFKRLFKK